MNHQNQIWYGALRVTPQLPRLLAARFNYWMACNHYTRAVPGSEGDMDLERETLLGKPGAHSEFTMLNLETGLDNCEELGIDPLVMPHELGVQESDRAIAQEEELQWADRCPEYGQVPEGIPGVHCAWRLVQYPNHGHAYLKVPDGAGEDEVYPWAPVLVNMLMNAGYKVEGVITPECESHESCSFGDVILADSTAGLVQRARTDGARYEATFEGEANLDEDYGYDEAFENPADERYANQSFAEVKACGLDNLNNHLR